MVGAAEAYKLLRRLLNGISPFIDEYRLRETEKSEPHSLRGGRISPTLRTIVSRERHSLYIYRIQLQLFTPNRSIFSPLASDAINIFTAIPPAECYNVAAEVTV